MERTERAATRGWAMPCSSCAARVVAIRCGAAIRSSADPVAGDEPPPAVDAVVVGLHVQVAVALHVPVPADPDVPAVDVAVVAVHPEVPCARRAADPLVA